MLRNGEIIIEVTEEARRLQMGHNLRAFEKRRELTIRFLIQSHLMGKFFDFREVALHFAPAVPERIIGIIVECALESSHSVL